MDLCGHGSGLAYSENQAEDMTGEAGFMRAFDDWVERFATHVIGKGKVEPGEFARSATKLLRLEWQT